MNSVFVLPVAVKIGLLILIGQLMTTMAYADQYPLAVKDTISVRGFGEVSAEPDQAMVSLSVSTLHKDVNQAKADVDANYKAVIAASKKQGIADLDIKTSGINVQPEYQWLAKKRVLVGTRVSRSISITVNDIDRVAALLQALVESNVSTINNVTTGFKDRRSLERKALQAAIDDAQEKAAFLAQQFDKTLGSAYSISEYAQTQVTPMQYGRGELMAKSMSADVPQEHFGTQSVKASISVVFHSH